MLNKKRITALLLYALLLSQTLASCGSEEGSSDTTAPDTTVSVETGYEIYHDLGELDFEGKEFNMWIFNVDEGLYMEEETGDIQDDTVFARNRTVEEQLNIKLNFLEQKFGSSGEQQSAGAAQLQANILAGDDTYHVYQHVQHGKLPGLVNEGNFFDWNTIPNVDLSKPYWYQGCIEDINYGTKIYTLTGAYTLDVMASANCLFFNKQILEESQIEYPYQMVLDGTWTFDKWVEMIETTTSDLNGDTKIDPTNDRYGYWGWGHEQCYGLFVGMGGDIVTKDADNLPVTEILTDRNVEIVDRINDLFKLEGAGMEWNDYSAVNPPFKNGNVTFLHASIGWATNYRDMEDDFGFIPYPKYDESQEDYDVRIQNTANMSYIPVTNSELDFTGAVLEVLAAESYNTVIPTYFDTVLTVKSTRDTESEQMVPVIIESTSFYDSAVTSFSLGRMVMDGSALATYYAGVETKVQDDIKTMIETYTGVKAAS